MDLVWLIHGSMRPEKRVARLRLARRWHEARLADVEAQVVAVRTALAIIDDALAGADKSPARRGADPHPSFLVVGGGVVDACIVE